MNRNAGKNIYGERRDTPIQDYTFDKQVVDNISKPLISYNRRLLKIIDQMINTQGPDYKKDVIIQRLNLLKQEISNAQLPQ
jgi:hypothetical protein